MLTALKEKEELVIYPAAANEAVSAVLMMKGNGKQMHIYFVSHALQGPKINYTMMEKLILALERTKNRCAEQDGIHNFAHLSKQILVEELNEKSIDEKEVLAIVEEEGHIWMTPIYEYLTEKFFQKKIERQELYTARQANYALREIHEGSCSMHADPRSVVAKALRSGYYWPTMHADARKLIRECNSYQRIDIAGPFPEGPGKVKFLIVAIDYFTKWIEAKPVAKRFHINREAPFSLTYGIKAVIPVEIGMPTLRTVEVDMIKNDEALEINLGLLEEKKE
nr:reverse transcriptase domain-containing protein [Tanacetum cinerariifolium]